MPESTSLSQTFGCTILGSGSGGNASVIHGPEGNLLLDAGFSALEIRRRMKKTGIDPASICAILITHAHGDHTRGCARFSHQNSIPAYLIPETVLLMKKKEIPQKLKLFDAEIAFKLCGIQIRPFIVSHDTPAVGFTFSACGKKIGFATDLGFVSDSIKKCLEGCDLLVLESNYDTYKLSRSQRGFCLKRRIAGKFGHLGNTQAMEALSDLLAENTKHLVLAHISRECNDYQLVSKLTEARLAELNRQDVAFHVATQDAPLDPICLE